MAHYELDTSGLLCPLPLVKTKKFLKQLDSGDTVLIVSTDPSSVLDFKVFVATSGHELLKHYQSDQNYYFLIKKT